MNHLVAGWVWALWLVMSVFHDEVEIEDFEYDEDSDTYYYPCPCGDQFQITRVSAQRSTQDTGY